MPRWANEGVELHDRAVPAGEMVMLLWASANRDPQQFPEPDRCLLDRTRTSTSPSAAASTAASAWIWRGSS